MSPDIKRLKRQAKRMLNEHLAILAFFGVAREKIEKERNTARKALAKGTRQALAECVRGLRTSIAGNRRIYGVKVPTSEIVAIIEHARNAPNGRKLLVAKPEIERVTSAYGEFLPGFNELPVHARIEIDADGRLREGATDWVLLETVVFEEMCALWNLYYDVSATSNDLDKVRIKSGNALAKATINHAFYFVEAFVNGLACDTLLTNADGLSEQDIGLLQERDLKKNRPKYLTLRDKILQYPRLSLRSAHPPLTESNCESLAFIVEQAKSNRDALVHPSPLTKPGDSYSKEDFVLNPTRESVERTVDSAISLVRELQQVVHPERPLRGCLKSAVL